MTESRLAAQNYIEALSDQGIEYLFINPGTDFPPIVEAYARAQTKNVRVPTPILAPHENAAVCMAHGYTMVTGRAQSVMLHVNVGTANGICGLINASRERIPMLFTAGRTPFTEDGPEGTRSGRIHWAQEMYDQAGMLREVVKWDYELKRGDHVDDVVERAMEVSQSTPTGPVYLSLPREALGETVADVRPSRPRRARAAPANPSFEDIATLCEWITAARNPLILVGSAGRSVATTDALAALAQDHALPVVSAYSSYFVLPHSHPMFQGSMPSPLLQQADLIITIETDVPWIPSREKPDPDARVVQIGEDPVYRSYPMRSFRSDLLIAADPAKTLFHLNDALKKAGSAAQANTSERRGIYSRRSNQMRERWKTEAAASGEKRGIDQTWLNHCLADLLERDSIVVSEYAFRPEYCPLERPGSFFGSSSAGGLGWGLPAALGAKLASPDQLVVALLGDGAYMFANPIACHWISAAQKLPILTVVYNNLRYGAVRKATLDMYGRGAAAGNDGRLFADFGSLPAFHEVITAHGGYGEAVERPHDLPAALARAKAMVLSGRQALVNVICTD